MTYEQNVKAILESNFAGFKEEIIDIACKRICMLGTKEETIDRVLEIIDGHRYVSEDEMWSRLWNVGMANLKEDILDLKGGDKE